jgi:MFS family permease
MGFRIFPPLHFPDFRLSYRQAMLSDSAPHPSASDQAADKNWVLFLWFRLLFSCRFYYPVLAVLFLDLGLTATQYILLNVAWAAASLLSDVPAGVLADRFGRKPLLVGASCCMVLEMTLLCVAPRNGGMLLFLFCLGNRILSGLAEGLASGADEALVYDSLAERGRSGQWHQVLEQVTRWQSVGMVFAMLIGGAVYAPGFMNNLLGFFGLHPQFTQGITLRFPVYLTLISSLGVLLLALCFKEAKQCRSCALENPDGSHASSVVGAFRFVGEACSWLFKSPVALFVVVAGLLLDSSARLFLTFSSSYFRLIGIPEASFGLLGAAMAGLGFFVSPWARKMVSKNTVGQSFNIIASVVLIGLCGVALHLHTWGVFFAFPLGAAMTLIGFTVSSTLNHLVDSHHRATVLSFKGVAFNLAYAGISLLFALALQHLHGADTSAILAKAFALLPVWLILVWSLLLIAFHQHRRVIMQKLPA